MQCKLVYYRNYYKYFIPHLCARDTFGIIYSRNTLQFLLHKYDTL